MDNCTTPISNSKSKPTKSQVTNQQRQQSATREIMGLILILHNNNNTVIRVPWLLLNSKWRNLTI
jgi:hypothetical protein